MNKKLKRRRVYVTFKDNICEAGLGEKGLLSCFDRGVKYLLYMMNAFIKYASAKSLKNK